MPNIGLLHPGAMGASIGAALRGAGSRVSWCPAGRSGDTRRRADAAGLTPVGDLRELAQTNDIILSICPPDAALETARSVAAEGFAGVYVDANAVSAATALAVERTLTAAGAACVDGGII